MAKIPAGGRIGSPLHDADTLVKSAAKQFASNVVDLRQIEAFAMRDRANALAAEIAPIYVDVMFLMRHEHLYPDGHEQFVAKEKELTEKKRELSRLLTEIRDFENALPALEAFVKQFEWES